MSKIEVSRPVSDWAKLPIDWIREGGLGKFEDESYSLKSLWMTEDKSARNVCISSLKLYLALCCRADFPTGNASVTYEELIRLTGLSRPTVAKALKRLETEELIQRKAQALRKGSSIQICGWLENKGWAKIPKRWLYDGSLGGKILMLTEFNFSRASLSALKIYIALLAYRDSKRGGIAVLSYDKLVLITGVKRHHIADAITRLYDLRMISFRQGNFSEESDFSRTNRYLVRGLGVHWPQADEFEIPQSSAHKSRPSAAGIAAANDFVSTATKGTQ
ncbi:winged helix-turn-helix transcriptional regulator [Pseudomonas sp. 14A]|uniref:winged helix-turn-helix transcriptional regulator n=1 Tax=Pseudomonas sp. 14A TaxID=2823142 RepID=UPI001B83AEEB|nr:winged helix-turn-helix transcriptional regulator [Pseudomonas sp. 14A]MBR7200324.1 GntR family transcriptional regulator [Pseudomonas sp. 14A]